MKWLNRQKSHQEEISGLIFSIQKGIVSKKHNVITPVISDEEYKLLMRFIEVYVCGQPLQVTQMTHIQKDSTYNLVSRLRDSLKLATNDQWSISEGNHDTLYRLEQAKQRSSQIPNILRKSG
jgi:hypothetical protein